MVEDNGVNSDNGIKFLPTAAQPIEIFRLLCIGGEVRREIRVAKHPFSDLHIARERPGRRDGDAGIFDALVEKIGIFNKCGNKLAILYFDDRILPEKSTTRAKFVVILEQYEESICFVVVCGECLDELIGDIHFLFGVGFERKELGDLVKDIESARGDFGFVGLPVEENKKSPSEKRESDEYSDQAISGKPGRTRD